MKKKSINDIAWIVSLVIMAIASLIIIGTGFFGLQLPDTAIRVVGVVDIIALFVFTSVNKKKMEGK